MQCCAALPLSHWCGRPTLSCSMKDGPRWPRGSCHYPWLASGPLCSPACGTGGEDLSSAAQPEQQDSHRPIPEHFVLGCCWQCGCEDKDLRANINHRLKSAMTTWRNINGIFNKIHIVSIGELYKQRYQGLPKPALDGRERVLFVSCLLHAEGGRELDRTID